ncbi:MAG: hypothetical protein Q4B63_06425 [Clostridium perfringens]|nr:hypothetical protein [Clostridium perfringens]
MLKLKVISLVAGAIAVSGVSIFLLAFNGANSLQITTTNSVNYMNNSSQLMQRAQSIIKNDISKIALLNNEIPSLKDTVADQYVEIYRLEGQLMSTENKLNEVQLENVGDRSKIKSLTNNVNTLKEQISSAQTQLATDKLELTNDETTIKNNSENILKLQEQITTDNTTITGDESTIKSDTSIISNLKNELSSTENSLTNSENAYEYEYNQVAEANEDVSKDTTTINSTYSTDQQTLSSFKNYLNTVSTETTSG